MLDCDEWNRSSWKKEEESSKVRYELNTWTTVTGWTSWRKSTHIRIDRSSTNIILYDIMQLWHKYSLAVFVIYNNQAVVTDIYSAVNTYWVRGDCIIYCNNNDRKVYGSVEAESVNCKDGVITIGFWRSLNVRMEVCAVKDLCLLCEEPESAKHMTMVLLNVHAKNGWIS
jgi:hypothetical protein